jgi:hypothetical protein
MSDVSQKYNEKGMYPVQQTNQLATQIGTAARKRGCIVVHIAQHKRTNISRLPPPPPFHKPSHSSKTKIVFNNPIRSLYIVNNKISIEREPVPSASMIKMEPLIAREKVHHDVRKLFIILTIHNNHRSGIFSQYQAQPDDLSKRSTSFCSIYNATRTQFAF